MPTTLRSIRVNDEIWDRAKEVAEITQTSVTAMIVDYLKAIGVNPKVVVPKTESQTEVMREVTGKRPKPPPRPAHEPGKTILYDPATCQHPENLHKVLPYGRFCACGAKLT